MATRLKNLKVRKVDFVDEGANQDAHIRMIKRKDGNGQPGSEDNGKEARGMMKRLIDFIGRTAGMGQGEIDSVVDEIQKGSSHGFSEKISEIKNREITDEIWDICYALQSSLCSILIDIDLDGTKTASAMQGSLDEFYAVVKESIADWSNGKIASIVRKDEEISETDLRIMKTAVERLNESIEKACRDAGTKGSPSGGGTGNEEKQKGDGEEMKIDKSKLTDAEKAFLESIEKRCGIGDGITPGSGEPAVASAITGEEVTKPIGQALGKALAAVQPDGEEDIYKGLHPAVKAELETLKKFREDAEDRELKGIAKKYAIIGKKEEELLPLFKNLRAAGGTAYNDMIAVLDQTVEAIEKSGVFSEIGKSGNHGQGGNSAEAKINGIAKGYMEKDPALSYSAALAKAWEENPEILCEYDEEAGF